MHALERSLHDFEAAGMEPSMAEVLRAFEQGAAPGTRDPRFRQARIVPLVRYLDRVQMGIDGFYAQVEKELGSLSPDDRARLSTFAVSLGARLMATLGAAYDALDGWRMGEVSEEHLAALFCQPWAILEDALCNGMWDPNRYRVENNA